MADVSDSISINSTAQAAFDALSHLERMGEFSPENTGGHWVSGGPALGAKFRGTNANGKDRWTTSAKVTTFDSPRRFGFDVSVALVPVSRWLYEISGEDGSITVTETWQDRRSALARKVTKGAVTDRESFTRNSIRHTLENLKRVLESA